MSNQVIVSASKLIEMCDQALTARKEYKGEDDTTHDYYAFSFLKMKRVNKPYKMSPSWTYAGIGIDARLLELRLIASGVLDDEYLEKKDVLLSHTTYGELIKLLNKSKDFQPYMFGMGY